MATTDLRIPGLTDDEQEIVNRLLAQLSERAERNLLRAAYYDGKRALRQVGTLIPPQYYRLGIVLGWSAKAVDTLARRCNIDGLVWPDGNLAKLDAPRAWQAYRLGARFSSALTSSLIYGPAFLVVTSGGDGEPPALLHTKNARNATGDWNQRLWRLDNLLSITTRGQDGKPTGLALYLDGLTVTANLDADGWTVERQQHDMGLPVEALVYRQRDDREWGSPRISRTVMSLHDQALRTVVRMEAHNDIYTIPDLWMFGADEAIFKNADGSQKAQWQVVMGRVKGIPDNNNEDAKQPRADVKQFPASSPQPHIDALKQQAQLFAGETSIPLTSLGVSDMSNPTSADSYIASREDLIAEAEGATDDWTPAIQRTAQRFLATLAGYGSIPDDWATIAPKWRSPVYLSRAAAADAGAKAIGAVPWLADTSVALEILGLDEQQVVRALAEKNRAEARTVLSGLLGHGQVVTSGVNGQ